MQRNQKWCVGVGNFGAPEVSSGESTVEQFEAEIDVPGPSRSDRAVDAAKGRTLLVHEDQCSVGGRRAPLKPTFSMARLVAASVEDGDEVGLRGRCGWEGRRHEGRWVASFQVDLVLQEELVELLESAVAVRVHL